MYRKYHSSTKSSRNERLAQLSEQESVIEKKKREILAKLEAQKKRETEAQRKLEPSTVSPNADKKDSIFLFAKRSLIREKEMEDEELTVSCPRNAFSNDGSFLDHFKKLSSELNQKNINLCTATNVTRRDESRDDRQKSETDFDKKNRHILNTFERREHNVEENKDFSKRKLQNLNVQHQLSSSGFVHRQIPPVSSRKSNNKASHFPESQVISQNIVEVPMVNNEQNTGDVAKDTFSHIQISRVESPLPRTSELMSTAANLRAQISFNPQPDVKREDGDEQRPVFNVCAHTSAGWDTVGNESKNENSTTLSRGGQMPEGNFEESDEFSRVSPAFTDCKAERKEEEQSTYAAARQDEGAGSCTKNCGFKRRNVPIESSPISKNAGHDVEEGHFDEKEKVKRRNSDCDSIDPDNVSKESKHPSINLSYDAQLGKAENFAIRDGYQADYDEEIGGYDNCGERQRKTSYHKSSGHDFSSRKGENLDEEGAENQNENEKFGGDDSLSRGRIRRKRKSRWGDEVVESNATSTGMNSNVQLTLNMLSVSSGPGGRTPMLSKLTRSDPGLIQYARQTFGSTNLSEEDWKKAEDHYKINLLYQDMVKKRAEIDRLEKAGKFKYEYDSDEDVEGGTWEHKLRQQEMMATQLWAEELTRQAAGKHHIGDFLPPEELERFMEKYNAVKQGRNPDLSDYKEFKLKEDNVGYRLLQKMGWNEGQGLGQDGTGITNPVNKASTRHENRGLGVDRPDGLQAGDDEYDAYRKRMMLAYRFRPNPLNNPRRPYY